MQADAAPATKVTELQAFPAGTPAPHITPLPQWGSDQRRKLLREISHFSDFIIQTKPVLLQPKANDNHHHGGVMT